MKLADRIILHLLKYGRKYPSEIMLPNFYHFGYEMDMFKLTAKHLVVEYEVKISRADYFNDFKKFHTNYGPYDDTKLEFSEKTDVLKHDFIRAGKAASSFCFVVPEGLIKPHEVPKHCGLMYFRAVDPMYTDGVDYMFSVKPSPTLHKNKFTDFQKLAKSLSWRENNWRKKYYGVQKLKHNV